MIINVIFLFFLPDLDMKKDIDTLIAEERADIIAKYDKVSVCAEVPSATSDNKIGVVA